MREPRMFHCLIREQRETELFDAPQTLKFRRINQSRQQFSFGRVGFQPNNVVNRIAVNFFRQCFLLSLREIVNGKW